MNKFILGLVVFLGVHSISIFSREWRNAMVEKLGTLPFKALYAVLSLIGLVALIYGYGEIRATSPILYTTPAWLRMLAAVLLLPVFPLFIASNFPSRIKASLKHPLFAATKLWAFAHLLANGRVSDVILFGAFLLWAVIGRMSASRRFDAVEPTAPTHWRNDIIAIVLGLALYVGFALWWHQALIGVAVR